MKCPHCEAKLQLTSVGPNEMLYKKCPDCKYSVPAEDVKIKSLYVFIATDQNGNEGIPAIKLGDIIMPLVAADVDRVKDLIPSAEHIAHALGRVVKLYKFHEMTFIKEWKVKREHVN